MTKLQRKITQKRLKENVRPYRSLFAIVVEGQTEYQYFLRFKRAGVKIALEKGNHSNPSALLCKAEGLLDSLKAAEQLRPGDQAWIILDRDQWTTADLDSLYTWAKARKDRGIGLSDPQFEYWLLLHFTNGVGVNSQNSCLTQLKQHYPNFKKGRAIPVNSQQILDAIERGYKRLPSLPGSLQEFADKSSGQAATSVHFLVEMLAK